MSFLSMLRQLRDRQAATPYLDTTRRISQRLEALARDADAAQDGVQMPAEVLPPLFNAGRDAPVEIRWIHRREPVRVRGIVSGIPFFLLDDGRRWSVILGEDHGSTGRRVIEGEHDGRSPVLAAVSGRDVLSPMARHWQNRAIAALVRRACGQAGLHPEAPTRPAGPGEGPDDARETPEPR